MRKASLVVSKYLNDNRIFDDSGVHRDNIFDRFVKLRDAFYRKGYDLSTSDINSIKESEVVIYSNNMPSVLPSESDFSKSYLILSESSFIKPENFDLEKHKFFRKIFTWSDDLVDNKKYVKLNYAHSFEDIEPFNIDVKSKLCVLIAGNKRPPHTNAGDLYAERINAIRWFEKNHPESFDLYGVGWDRYFFYGNKFIRQLNKIPSFARFCLLISNGTYPSYKGMIDNKKDVMKYYKFSICYENAENISGYITEKIFDSFFSGCVPVYLGANNVTEHIPKECFIDRRNYSTYEELYDYLNNMPDEDYMAYLQNIRCFLNDKKSWQFRSEGFVETIMKTIFESEYDHN